MIAGDPVCLGHGFPSSVVAIALEYAGMGEYSIAGRCLKSRSRPAGTSAVANDLASCVIDLTELVLFSSVLMKEGSQQSWRMSP